MNQQGNDIQPAKQGIPVMLVAQPIEENGFYLFDLLQTLVRRKILIAGITASVTVIGILYALLASPVYQAETSLTQPSMQDIRELILVDDSYTPEKVYNDFVKGMNSKAIRSDYFLNAGVARQLFPEAKTEQQLRRAFQSFNRSLQWNDGTLTMTGPAPKETADLLNGLVQYTEGKVKERISTDLKTTVGIKITQLNHKVDSLIAKDTSNREIHIERVNEALRIASKLGISDYSLSPLSDASSVLSQEKKGNTTSSITDFPLYLRGTKTLQAELTTLQKRNEDVHSIPGVPQLKEQIKQLKELVNFGNDDFRVVTVSEAAIAPDYPIKPKRKAIILVSFLLGLFTGLFVAFLTTKPSPSQREITDRANGNS